MIYVSSFMKIGSDIQNLLDENKHADTQTARISHKPIPIFFLNKESRLKILGPHFYHSLELATSQSNPGFDLNYSFLNTSSNRFICFNTSTGIDC
jgi:hypothetical protein